MNFGMSSMRMGRKENNMRGKIILIYGQGQNPKTHKRDNWAT
jgi:hypothetical protein